MDEKDKKILKTIRFNGRERVSKIAKAARLSKEVTSYRIKRLMDKRIILRFVPKIDNRSLGYSVFKIALKMTAFDEDFERKLTEYFFKSELPIVWFGYTYGEWDVILDLIVHNAMEFYDIMEELLNEYGQYILNKEIAIQIKDIFKHYEYLYGKTKEILISPKMPKKRNNEIGQYKEIIQTDKTDLKILSLLYEDARMSSVDIAKRTKLFPDTVRYRIRRMLSSGAINSFITAIDRTPLGYRKFKVLLYFKNITPQNIKQIINYSIAHPYVSHITTTVGAWDMEIDYDAETPEQFNKMFTEFRNMFHGIIRGYSVLINYKYYFSNPFISMIKQEK